MFPLGDETNEDPRGPIALARVNWLHRRYHIVSNSLTMTYKDAHPAHAVKRGHALHIISLHLRTNREYKLKEYLFASY